MTYSLTDLFCGAGGSLLGAESVPGVRGFLAANHWQQAIDSHQANFPHVAHDCADISQVRPQRYRTTDILWASPECFAAGTIIVTRRGLIPIEDVVVDDEVITHRGRFRRVTATMNRIANTVVIRGQGNSEGIETTSEHPIWVRDSREQAPEWRRAQSVTLGSYWATPTSIPESSIPEITGPRPIHVKDERFAWLVGRWLGDGSLRVRPKGSDETFVTCGNHEADQLEKVLSWVHHNCSCCAPELTWSRRQLKTAVVFANSHSELARWLVTHFGRHSHGKTVPTWALGAPTYWREALLAGYLSADGHDDSRGYSAASVSKRLALGIRLLAESLGHRTQFHYYCRSTWNIQGRSGKARGQWTVRWLHEEKKPRAFGVDGHSWAPVKAIEPGRPSETVYDLTVDGDHSYVADGIVVHNCTNHSMAKGRKRATAQSGLFGDLLPDEAADRSRATMWDVPRFCEYHRYRAVVVENVVDAAKWVMWPAWLKAMELLGYQHRTVWLNSMHAPAMAAPRAPQSRDRLYVVFWRRGDRAPDVEPCPLAWCPTGDHEVAAVQSWKNPKVRWGRYRTQYVYRCPSSKCRFAVVEPYADPAASAIDWTLPGQRIGDRKVPLKPKTLARIELGLERYGRPMTFEARGSTYVRTGPDGRPRYARAWPVDRPTATLHTTESRGLVVPYYSATTAAQGSDEPLPTVTTRDRFGVAFIAELHGGGSVARDVDEPLATVLAGGNHHMLVRNNGTRETGDGMMCSPVDEPARTMTTTASQSLVGWSSEPPRVEDCTFRMLEPSEIQRAMAFTPSYKVLGSRRARVRQLGNSVTPPASEWLITKIVDALG